MPPAVVYTDVDETANVNGRIFEDIKFFITQRTPSRTHYVSLVEKNGGRVVKLESQADYLIADHVRPGAPPGSYSYKLIDESIKNGELFEDTTPFLVADLGGRVAQTTNPRYTAVASTAKSTRTPFSTEDDRLLYAWVKQAERKGAAVKGNELYKQLAERNNRHTSHSWRDRYLKVLSFKPPAGWESYVTEDVPDFGQPVARLSSTAAPRPSSIAPACQPSTTNFRSVRATPAAPPASATPRQHRVPFTDEDDNELLEWVALKGEEGLKVFGNKIYEQLAACNPRHTAQSWRSRYVDHLQHEYQDDALADLDATASPQHLKRNIASPSTRQPHQNSAASSSKLPNASPLKRPKTTFRDRHVQAESHLGKLVDDTSFTQDEHDNLLSVALDVQNITVGRYQEAWIAWAAKFPQHTAVAWRSYYERRILPIVMERKDDPDFIKKLNGDESEFWRNQGQPVLSLPYMLDNEEDEDEDEADADAEFAMKTDPGRTTSKAAEVNTKHPEQALSHQNTDQNDTSKIPESSRQQNPSPSSKRKLEQHEPDKEISNQKRRRVLDQTPAKVTASAPRSAQEQQQQIEDEDIIHTSSQEIPNSDLTPSAATDEAEAQLQREIASQVRNSRPPLTAANLRLAQVERDTPSKGHQRGVDLVEDDEEDDQDDFAGYLERLIPKQMQDKMHKHNDQEEDIEEGEEEEQQEQAEEQNEQAQEEEDEDFEQEEEEEEWVVQPDLDMSPLFEPLHDDNNLAPELELEPETTEPIDQPRHQSLANRLDTQDIYAAKTQVLDLSIPDPPLSPTLSDRPDSQVLSEDEIWPYVDSQVLKGYSEPTIFQALRKTSMNPKLATIVLDAGDDEVDMGGVWTEEEDRIAEGGDAKAMRMLEVKHGNNAVMYRLKFLVEAREDEEDLEGVQ